MARSSPVAYRIAAGVVLAVGVVAVAGTLAAGIFSVLMARKVVMPGKRRLEDIEILEVTDSTITLSSTLDTLLPGTYSLWFSRGSGHAKIGDILSSTPNSVTRALIAVDFGDLGASERGYLTGWVYLGPKELLAPYSDILIDAPVGPCPAWLIPAAEETGRWMIGVHGRGVRRQECLRAVDIARRCGYTSLLVSYRNDGDAPASEDGRYTLGDTEWLDVDATISYALDHGATEVVLMGWSMGGATVLQAAMRSKNSPVIRGLILDSPVIDWMTTLDFQADLMRIPRPVGLLAKQLIGQPWSGRLTGQAEPIELSRLDFVTRASELAVPILLLHSADDGFVPVDASRELAAARPDIVTYDEFTVARHTKLWNYDAERWNNDIGSWLSRL